MRSSPVVPLSYGDGRALWLCAVAATLQKGTAVAEKKDGSGAFLPVGPDQPQGLPLFFSTYLEGIFWSKSQLQLPARAG